MTRYRTRSREIEAVQWLDDENSGFEQLPKTFRSWVYPNGSALTCYTKQGPVRAEKGDWLILGDHEVYPCKPDEFEKRYELVPEDIGHGG